MKKFTKDNLQLTVNSVNELFRYKNYNIRYEIGYKAIKETITISPRVSKSNVHAVNSGTIKELVIFAWGLQTTAAALPVLKKKGGV
jgi:hypothetical protein